MVWEITLALLDNKTEGRKGLRDELTLATSSNQKL